MTEARQRATSDFERDVLADGKIADQEVQQGRELFKACMEDKGYVVCLIRNQIVPPGYTVKDYVGLDDPL